MALLGQALPVAAVALAAPAVRAGPTPITKPIPVSGERLPVIGMGTWLTFDVGDDAAALASRQAVLQAFFAAGGSMIDSSPMYGSAETVLGRLLRALPRRAWAGQLFSATKVWTIGRGAGDGQMRRSLRRWGLERFDLMQVHNLLDWRAHLPTMRLWREQGLIRTIGVTTSHGWRHAELEAVLRAERLDFVQFTYSIGHRAAERRLLPLARDLGIAVIANRPFDGGALFDRVRGRDLPPWAAEFDCGSWAQFFLKFIVSHPAVSCAIPATRRLDHMRDNMGANFGRLPDAAQRAMMARLFEAL
ncbi:MAG: aldo/keto reductase [Burkholderiales bacterium]|nr:MAG: aldo/keto reductase [Burkholderiales bacterium]